LDPGGDDGIMLSTMPSKRQLLDALKRDELLAVVDAHDIGVADRRKKDAVVDAIVRSRSVKLDLVLGDLSRERLKELCRELGLDDGGRAKADILERLVNGATGKEIERNSGAPGALAEQLQLPTGEKLTRDRLERYLWSAADILRGSIDS
jgi:hypothetical protein